MYVYISHFIISFIIIRDGYDINWLEFKIINRNQIINIIVE